MHYQDTRELVISRRDSKIHAKKRGRPTPLAQTIKAVRGYLPAVVGLAASPGRVTATLP